MNKDEIIKTLDMMKTKATNYDYSHTRASPDDPDIYNAHPQYMKEFERCQKMYNETIEYIRRVLE